MTFQRHWRGLLNDTGGAHNRVGDNDRQPSADDNVWGGEDLKAHLDGQPSITQPVSLTPLLCTSELRRKENKTMRRNRNNKYVTDEENTE